MLTLAAIRIYPVKGFRGLSLTEGEVEPWGLAGDRRWMVVDADNRFLTQRQVPAMARLEALPRHGGLTLAAPGADFCEVPLPLDSAPPAMVTVWDSTVLALSASREADAWLSARLGLACRLVYMAHPDHARAVDPLYGAPEDRVSFADGFPLLVTTNASLDDLNSRLAVPVPMDRFRTNLLIAGGTAWMEDDWTGLRVGGTAFKVVKDCARCAVTTVDQASGVKDEDAEPLRCLGGFRRDAKGRIIFGQNLIPSSTGGIAVGDRVDVI